MERSGDHRVRLSAAAARAAAERAAKILSANPEVKLVYLFGSAVDSTTPDIRDVDLAILTEPAFSLETLMKCRADLVATTHAPIDLVSLNEASIVLAWEVVDRGVCLFARDPDIETATLLDEGIGVWQIAGAAFVLGGVALTTRARGRRSGPARA